MGRGLSIREDEFGMEEGAGYDLQGHGQEQQVPPLRFPFPAGKRSFGRNDKVYLSCYLLLSFLIPDEERCYHPNSKGVGQECPTHHGQHQKRQGRRAFGPRTAEGGCPHIGSLQFTWAGGCPFGKTSLGWKRAPATIFMAAVRNSRFLHCASLSLRESEASVGMTKVLLELLSAPS